MTVKLDLLNDEDAILECNVKGGDSIQMDIFELELLNREVFEEHGDKDMPSREWLSKMSGKILDAYDIKLSLRNVDAVMAKQQEMIKALKKNTPQSSEPESSTESSQQTDESSSFTD